jgi:hypothetical protein
MLVHPAALQCSNAGAALFKDVVALEHFQKCVQLVRPADQFKHHAARKKKQLEDAGWNAIVVWECQLRPEKRDKTLEELESMLKTSLEMRHRKDS